MKSIQAASEFIVTGMTYGQFKNLTVHNKEEYLCKNPDSSFRKWFQEAGLN